MRYRVLTVTCDVITMIGLGTVLNVLTVIVGGIAGIRLGDRLPEHVRETVMQGIGLFTFAMGIHLTMRTQNLLVVLAAVLIGGVLGALWRLDERLERLGAWLETRYAGDSEGDTDEDRTALFVRGFVSASLVFCVGPMTVVGSIQDGLGQGFELLAVKSVLDGFAALAFASTMGPGVVFASLTVGGYQGGLTLLAAQTDTFLTDQMVGEMTAAGGVLILGIGLVLLKVAAIRLAAFLPALPMAVAIVALLDWLGVAWAG